MKKHTPEQVVDKLRRVEALVAEGATVAKAVREIEVSEQTYYRWKRHYGGVDKSEAKRLRELEKENARLKKLLAEQALDNDILREVARGKFRRAIPPRQPDTRSGRGCPRPARARRERASRLPRARAASLDAALRLGEARA